MLCTLISPLSHLKLLAHICRLSAGENAGAVMDAIFLSGAGRCPRVPNNPAHATRLYPV